MQKECNLLLIGRLARAVTRTCRLPARFVYYVCIMFSSCSLTIWNKWSLRPELVFWMKIPAVPKRISCLEDCQLLQDDLYKILDWSRWNNTKLHEQKFELLNHLYSKNSVLPELPFHNKTLSY